MATRISTPTGWRRSATTEHDRKAAFEVPVRIVLLRETLPRNANGNGKIMKKAPRPLFDDARFSRKKTP